MHRIARDDMACQVELFQQFLRRRYFVGLFVDFDMRKHECRVDSKRAEHLFRLGVVEAIKTAFERLTVKGDNSPARNCRIKVQMAACSRKAFSTSVAVSPCRIYRMAV